MSLLLDSARTGVTALMHDHGRVTVWLLRLDCKLLYDFHLVLPPEMLSLKPSCHVVRNPNLPLRRDHVERSGAPADNQHRPEPRPSESVNLIHAFLLPCMSGWFVMKPC